MRFGSTQPSQPRHHWMFQVIRIHTGYQLFFIRFVEYYQARTASLVQTVGGASNGRDGITCAYCNPLPCESRIAHANAASGG